MPLTLFLDFDGTLTTHDTTSLLAHIPSLLPSSSPPPSFAPLTHLYTQSLHHHATHSPPTPQRTTPALELAHLASLRPVEAASIQRVEAAGLFRGVRGADLRRAAGEMVRKGEVCVRGGARACVEGVKRGGGWVDVVSVGWSRGWVRAVLEEGWGRERGEGKVREGVSGAGLVEELGVCVYANELLGVEDAGGSSGFLDRWWGVEGGGIWTSADKVRVVRGVLVGRRGRSVYVGDSVTDLEALLEVDVGVCVRDEEMGDVQRELRDCLARVAVECEWVGGWRASRVIGKGEREGEEKRLWWARDFGEIAESGILDEEEDE